MSRIFTNSLARTNRRLPFLRRGRFLSAVALACLLDVSSSSGQTTVNWSGGASGNWSVAGNWTPNGVPNGNFNVNILAPANAAVSLDIVTSVNQLNMTGTNLNYVAGNRITIQSSAALTGGAIITMNDRFDGGGSATAALSLANSTIQGFGQLGAFGLMSVNNQAGGLIHANVNGQTLTLASSAGVTNTGTLRASNGGTLLIQTNVANAGGTIEALTGSQVQITANATIGGGVLTGAGTILLNSAGLNGTANAITNTGNVVLNNSTADSIQGNLVNNGTILTQGVGNATRFFMTGAVNLTGAGTLTLADNLHRIDGDGATAFALTNSSTIQGVGNIGSTGLMSLVNQSAGVIQANVSTGTLQVSVSAGLTNMGILRATNGGVLNLSGITIANNGGTLNAQAGSQVQVTGSTLQGGTLSTAGTGSILLNSGFLDGSANAIANTGLLQLNNSSANGIQGTINNSGGISLLGAGNATRFFLQGNTTLSGAGTLTLADAQHRIDGNGSTLFTLTNSSTIQGVGSIGNFGLFIFNNQASGLINANASGQTLTLNSSTTGSVNAGTLQASSGGTLSLTGSPFSNTTGTISALASSTVVLNGGTIQGGLLTGAGQIVLSSGTLDASTNTITNTGNVFLAASTANNLQGNLVNNGTILTQGVGNATRFFMTGAVNLTGTGTLTLADAQHRIDGNGLTAFAFTNSSTIRGFGAVGNFGLMSLVNTAGGVVDANVNGGTLLLACSAGIANTGNLQASNGGTLQISAALNNTGGTISALATSTVSINGGNIQGGTFQGAGSIVLTNGSTLNGVTNTITNTGNILVSPSTVNNLQGNLVNNGTILTQGVGNATRFFMTGAVNLTGTGTLTLADNLHRIDGNNSTAFAFTNSSTIRGFGVVGNFGSMSLVNTASGVVDANSSGNTLLLACSAGIANTGNLQASNGGTLQISAALNNTGGTISALATSTVSINGGNIQGGTFQGAGSIVLTNGSTLNGVTNTITNTGNILVAPSTVNNLQGNLVNNGTILTQGVGNATRFFMTGAVNLTGTGTLTLADAQHRIDGNNSTAFAFTNSSTVQGFGNIGSFGLMSFANQAGGVVQANVSGQTLLLNPSAGASNAGTFRATGGVLDVVSLTNLSSGTFSGGTYESIGNGSSLRLPGNIATNAASILLDSAGSQILNRNTSVNALATLTSNAAAGSLTLQNGATNAIASPLSNAGTLRVFNTSTLTVLGAVTQTAGLTQLRDAGGALTLGAGSAFNLNGGTLQGNGTLTAPGGLAVGAGSLAPGNSAGQLNVVGNTTFSAPSTLRIELGGTTQGTGYDFLNITGSVALGSATLDVRFINGFQNAVTNANSFTIVAGSAGVSGNFANLPNATQFTTADGLGTFQITYNGNNIVLSNYFPPVPEPAGMTALAVGLGALGYWRRKRAVRPAAAIASGTGNTINALIAP